MGEPFIHLAGVQKVYRTRGAEFLAISEATFDVEAGELVSLVGPSGCGKTTLLKILAGLHPYDSGEVTIGSRTQPFDPSRDIGMVFQQPLLLKWRRIIDNVLLPAEILGLPMAAEPRPRPRSARAGRARGQRGQVSLRALRRHAAARRDRARAHPRSQADPDGRAVRRARRAHAREDEPRAAAHLGGGEEDHRLRHPRHHRGGVSRHPRGRAHRRPGAHGRQFPRRAAASAHARHEDQREVRRIHAADLPAAWEWSEDRHGAATSRHHHERRHRPHGHEPASDPLDRGDPRAGRRRAARTATG